MTDVTTVLHRVGVNRDEELKGASKGCHRPTPVVMATKQWKS